ncbi:diguanylate cyclase [bacterium]|nr:diguanylate cyclase [bacterium]
MTNKDKKELAGGASALREFASTSQALLACSQLIQQQERSKERLSKLFFDHNDVIFFFSRQGQIVKGNQAFLNRFGVGADDWFMKPMTDLMSDRVARTFLDKVSSAANPSHVSFELPVPKDPTRQVGAQVEYHWVVQKYADSAVYEDIFVATGRDISDLREAESRIAELFRCLPIGLLTISGDDRIAEVYSQYSEVILGTSELPGKGFFEKIYRPSERYMSDSERDAAGKLSATFGQPLEQYFGIAEQLPKIVRRPLPPEAEDPKETLWLSLSYYPLIRDGLLDKILVVVQNQTDWVRERLEKESLRTLSLTDELTTLGNRRSLDMRLRSQCEGGEVEVLLADVDFFKLFNDSCGHLRGDECLKRVAQAINRACSSLGIPDVGAYRYGGEEFAVVVKKASRETLAQLATALGKAVEELGIEHNARPDGRKVVTISLGGVVHDGAAQGGPETNQGMASPPLWKEILGQADALLYEAKSSGRNANRVKTSSEFIRSGGKIKADKNSA